MQKVQGKAMMKKPERRTDMYPDIGRKRTSGEDKISVRNLSREQTKGHPERTMRRVCMTMQ